MVAFSNIWSLRARGSSRSFRCWLLKVNALLATTSTDGGVIGPEPSGNTGEAKADGGGDGDEHMSETGEMDPPLGI